VTRAKRTVTSSIIELVVIVAAALGLALAIQAFIVKPYRIPSGSMEPTLSIGQRILVDRIANNFSSPHVGEILVFHPPASYGQGCANPSQGENTSGQDGGEACAVAWGKESSQTFVKRVVGLPGDRISISDGHVIRDGIKEKDSYIAPCNGSGSCNFPVAVTIPRGDYFMMGDNRGESDDSRFWGPVPKGWIIGQAFFTYWPPGRFGTL
jgi:signal peptidase I